MPVYTVHEPPRRDDEIVAHTARFQFVRDGFHWWALLLTPFWMLRYRMWLELIVYLGLVACFRSRRDARDRRDRRLRLGQSALGGEGLRAGGARVRSRSADFGHERSRQGPRGRSRGAAGRRRVRGLPPRPRRGTRHGRGAE